MSEYKNQTPEWHAWMAEAPDRDASVRHLLELDPRHRKVLVAIDGADERTGWGDIVAIIERRWRNDMPLIELEDRVIEWWGRRPRFLVTNSKIPRRGGKDTGDGCGGGLRPFPGLAGFIEDFERDEDVSLFAPSETGECIY